MIRHRPTIPTPPYGRHSQSSEKEAAAKLIDQEFHNRHSNSISNHSEHRRYRMGNMCLRGFFSSLLLMSVCFTSSAVAQNPPRITSEPCRKVQNVPVRDTDRKIMSLRTTLNSLTKKRAELPPDAKTQLLQLERNIRTNQEALIELTFARECYRQD